MSKKHFICFLFISLFFLGSCQFFTSEHSPPSVQNLSAQGGEEVQVPLGVWKRLWIPADSFVLGEISVELENNTPGVLKQSPLKIIFKEGGTLDLREYLTGKEGLFYLKINPPFFEGSQESRVFFISQNRRRRLQGEIWGTGCYRWMDLSKALLQFGGEKGHLTLSTARARHLSVVGGTFIFAAQKGEKNLVTQLTLTDSAYRHLLCEGGNR